MTPWFKPLYLQFKKSLFVIYHTWHMAAMLLSSLGYHSAQISTPSPYPTVPQARFSNASDFSCFLHPIINLMQ